jgi:CheY-like chemotaxis protein
MRNTHYYKVCASRLEQATQGKNNVDMKSVLYVEDDHLCRTLVRTILSREGYTVIEATTAMQALSLVESNRPDLIIMDIYLPGEINGIEAAARIKSSPDSQHIPVVALSSDYQIGKQKSARAEGFDDFIGKPFDRVKLLGIVQQLIGPA